MDKLFVSLFFDNPLHEEFEKWLLNYIRSAGLHNWRLYLFDKEFNNGFVNFRANVSNLNFRGLDSMSINELSTNSFPKIGFNAQIESLSMNLGNAELSVTIEDTDKYSATAKGTLNLRCISISGWIELGSDQQVKDLNIKVDVRNIESKLIISIWNCDVSETVNNFIKKHIVKCLQYIIMEIPKYVLTREQHSIADLF